MLIYLTYNIILDTINSNLDVQKMKHYSKNIFIMIISAGLTKGSAFLTINKCPHTKNYLSSKSPGLKRCSPELLPGTIF
jgi:hypothetical protein